MLNLQQYNSSDDSNDSDFTTHLKPMPGDGQFASLQNKICAAPPVVPTVSKVNFKHFLLCNKVFKLFFFFFAS